MMQSRNGAARYQTVRSHGQVADASPARLVQIVYEHILSNLAKAQGCMSSIHNNMPYNDVVSKCKAMSKSLRLIGQLQPTLATQRGGKIGGTLHNPYLYM